ncbi:MAG: hypothetical protein HOW73_18245 [Polyangiaceae bacterium]|nr:hypothetical protein [Polyangiaceae bacterium]
MKPIHHLSDIPEIEIVEAFEALRPEIEALTDEELLPVTTDIPSAIISVLGSLPGLTGLRAAIVAESPTYDMTAYDRIELYALALAHAHGRHQVASLPPEPVAALVVEANRVRTELFDDVTVLARRKLVDEKALKRLRRTNSQKNVAFDLVVLVTLLRDNWPALAGKTAISSEELDAASKLANRLARALGARDHGEAVRVEATQTRLKAYTLFVTAYERVRRIVQFHRYEQRDADRFAPSLYRGRGGRGRAPRPRPAIEQTEDPR